MRPQRSINHYMSRGSSAAAMLPARPSARCGCRGCSIAPEMPGIPAEDEPQWEKGRPDPTLRSAVRFASTIRKAGFMPKPHFIERLAERVIGKGGRLDPKTFAGDFQRAEHYRQTREGYTMRVAVVDGIPILYRMGGPRGRHVVLGGLLPEGALPPSERIRPPQRELPQGETPLADQRGAGEPAWVDAQA